MRTQWLAIVTLSAVLTFLRANSVSAQQIVIDLDPAKTTIDFVLGDVLHTVHGRFHMKASSIHLDSATKQVSGSIAIDATTGDSGSGARDKRMKRDILEVQRYPEIAFTPTSITATAIESLSNGAPGSQANVSGWFSIHGQRHQISFPVQIDRSGSNVTATGSFVVPYVEWGMKDPSTFVLRVNKAVDVKVRAVGHIRQTQ